MSFTVRGFRINLKPSFFVMGAGLIILGQGRELCILVFSVTLHEMAHLLTARLFGAGAEGVVITPIGQQALIYGLESLSLFRRVLVVVAGPAVNLVLWLVFGSRINLALIVLNCLPVYPLDGGRLLHYILGYCLGVLRANRVQAYLSYGTGAVILGLGFIQPILYGYNISLLCIGLYLIKINKREYLGMTMALYRSLMYPGDRKVVRIHSYIAGGNTRLKTLVYRLSWDYYTLVYVRNPLGGYTHVVGEEELIGYIMAEGLNHPLRDVIGGK